MSPAVFETTILGSKRPQTHALDRAATGIGNFFLNEHKLWIKIFFTHNKQPDNKTQWSVSVYT